MLGFHLFFLLFRIDLLPSRDLLNPFDPLYGSLSVLDLPPSFLDLAVKRFPICLVLRVEIRIRSRPQYARPVLL